MNTPSTPTRCLLDKNVARYIINGLRAISQRPLSTMELGALAFWQAAEQQRVDLFLPVPTVNVLTQLNRYAEVRLLLNATRVLLPGRYCLRWARRIRESTGLTREDTMILSLGTFGTDETGSILGAHFIATYDQRLIHGYHVEQPVLMRRFQAMTAQLLIPFTNATLPRVVDPTELSRQWP